MTPLELIMKTPIEIYINAEKIISIGEINVSNVVNNTTYKETEIKMEDGTIYYDTRTPKQIVEVIKNK